MENPLWKMMIKNAKTHIKSFDPNKNSELITVWQISEVLAMLTGKLKEDIVLELMQED